MEAATGDNRGELPFSGVTSATVSGNRIFRPRGEAILLQGADMVEVTGNVLQDAGCMSTGATMCAVQANASNRVFIRNNTAYGSAAYAQSASAAMPA